ncbi:MAG: carboxylating nicotinate-nucleotide diphosphorylase [Woeseiaceae bacterium]|nr:carboxylating nicotinate-nucleotide diphosphorylase [Woeseiaceae bacterium]
MDIDERLADEIRANVRRALAEDVGTGDVTADLGPAGRHIEATIVAREACTLAGRPWADEVMRCVEPSIAIDWRYEDGERVAAEAVICTLDGPARPILTGERTALNFLQFLSATATETAKYVAAVDGTGCRILDTRKTIPGLRLAQKYAVRCGGGVNHRIGLYDAILIKENHILSVGGIGAAIAAAREHHPDLPVEVEVETLDELKEALAAQADQLLLDNFPLDTLAAAVAINRETGDPPAKLEASGGITLEGIREIAATGVDFISVGALTKNVRAIDLSMRFTAAQ